MTRTFNRTFANLLGATALVTAALIGPAAPVLAQAGASAQPKWRPGAVITPPKSAPVLFGRAAR